MLSKNNRVNKALFNDIMKNGVVIHSPVFLFRYVKSFENKANFAFVVPKAVARGAILRNKKRRQGYNSLKKHMIQGFSGIFFYKKGSGDATFTQIEDSVKSIILKLQSNKKL